MWWKKNDQREYTGGHHHHYESSNGLAPTDVQNQFGEKDHVKEKEGLKYEQLNILPGWDTNQFPYRFLLVEKIFKVPGDQPVEKE
jgi:hypothetical protein